MKDGWEIVPMGELCSIESGASDTKDAVQDGEFAFFDRSRTVKKARDSSMIAKPSSSPAKAPNSCRGISLANSISIKEHTLFLISLNEVDPKFLYHSLHHLRDYFPRVAVARLLNR